MVGNKTVRVYITRVKDKKDKTLSETVYTETKKFSNSGRLVSRTLERKPWGKMRGERIEGVYVSQERYRDLREKIVSKKLTLEEFNSMSNDYDSYDDIGGRFITWSKLDSGNLRFKKSADVCKIDPPFGKPDSY